MSTDYNYDDEGQFFPYFVLTIASLVTVPITYSLLKPSKDLENTAPRIQSDFKPEHEDLIEGQKKKQRRKERKLNRMIIAALGWALIAGMMYLIVVTSRSAPKVWDPYEVLGVSRSASEKQIKSHYRRLSLTLHPDKAEIDPSKNITLETVNDHWVEVTKAFKALTDEEIRNNYLQYGHPDGKQSFSIGIALPKWIVTEGHGKYVLLVYGALLGVLLPFLVGKWWYGTQKVTRDKILVASAGKLFREYDNELGQGGIIAAVSGGEEFKEMLKGNKADYATSKLESKILADGGDANPAGITIAGLTPKDRERLVEMDDGVRRKALALIWAYLGRVELDDPILNDEKYEVAPTAYALNEGFKAIALAYGNTQAILDSYHTSQNLIQAMPPSASPLLQLPHITPKIAKAIENNSRDHITVQEFMRAPADIRKKRATQPGLLSEQEYKNAIKVASQIPVLNVERAFFKVVGEKYITPGSLVQFVVKARIIPPGSQNVPEVTPADLEDIDPDEGDLDALHGRKKGDKASETPIQAPLANAPYFARDHSPRWHVFLTDSKQGKIVVPPFTFPTFDKPLFDGEGKPTYNVQTLKMQFGAPPQSGNYTFTMHLLSDSYVGTDTSMQVTLEVADPSKAEEMEEEEEISEPDEDSLAGQMSALKGGAPTKKRRVATQDDSDDDSATEEEEDDETDTDTDTDTDAE